MGLVFDAVAAANLIWGVVAGRGEQSLADRMKDRAFRRAVVRKAESLLASQAIDIDHELQVGISSLLRDQTFADNLLSETADNQLTKMLAHRSAAEQKVVTEAVRDALVAATVSSASRVDRELLARAAGVDEALLQLINIGLDLHDQLASLHDVLTTEPSSDAQRSLWTGDPPADYGVVIEEKLQQYPYCYGRQGELRELRSLMERSRLVNVVGDPWVGKSTVVAELVRERSEQPAVDLVFYFVDESTSRNSLDDFLYAVCSQLIRLIGAADGVAAEPERLLNEFEDLWQRARATSQTAGRHLVLVVDGFDETIDPKSFKRCFATVLRTDGLVLASRLTLSELHDADVVTGQAVDGAVELRLEPNEHAAIQRRELTRDIGAVATSRRRTQRRLLATLAATRSPMTPEELEQAADMALVDVLDGLDRLRRFLVGVGMPENQRWRFRHVEIYREVRRLVGDAELRRAEDRVVEWATRVGNMGWPDDTSNYLVAHLGIVLAARSDLYFSQWCLDSRRLVLGIRSAEAVRSLREEMRGTAELALASERKAGAAHIAAIGVKACLFQRIGSLIEGEAWSAIARVRGVERATALWTLVSDPEEAAEALPWILRGTPREEQPQIVRTVMDVASALDHDAGSVLLANAATALVDVEVAAALLDDAIERISKRSGRNRDSAHDTTRYRVLEAAARLAPDRVRDLLTADECGYIDKGGTAELLPFAWASIVRACHAVAPTQAQRVLAEAVHELVDGVELHDDPNVLSLAASEAIKFLAAVSDLTSPEMRERVDGLYALVNRNDIAEAIVAICAMAREQSQWGVGDFLLADAEVRLPGTPFRPAVRALGALAMWRLERLDDGAEAIVERILDVAVVLAMDPFQRSSLATGVASASAAVGIANWTEPVFLASLALAALPPYRHTEARLFAAYPAALANEHAVRIVRARENIAPYDHRGIVDWLISVRVFATSCVRNGNQAAAEAVVAAARTSFASGTLRSSTGYADLYYEGLVLPALAAIDRSTGSVELAKLWERRQWFDLIPLRDVALTLAYIDPMHALEVTALEPEASETLPDLALVLSAEEPQLAWKILSRTALAVPQAFLGEFVEACLVVGGREALVSFIRDCAMGDLLDPALSSWIAEVVDRS